MPIYGEQNTDSTTGAGFAGGYIAGVPAAMAWAIVSQVNDFVARRNDAHTWAWTILDIELTERRAGVDRVRGGADIVFAVRSPGVARGRTPTWWRMPRWPASWR